MGRDLDFPQHRKFGYDGFMSAERSNRTLFAVIALLIAQVVLFLISLDAFMAISIFCSVTTGASPPIFGVVHFAYLGLFFLGILSLFWRRVRLIYLVGITVALVALPVQVWMLENDKLQCNAP
jgi:hypothetical protein